MLRECTIRYEALLLHGTVFHKLPPKVAESSLCAKLYFGQALGGLRVVGFSKETIGSMFPNSATKTINWLLHCKDKFKTSAEGQERGTWRQKKRQKRERLREQGQHTWFWISAGAWPHFPQGWVRSQPATTHQQKGLQPFPKCIWIFWITPTQTPLNVCLWRDIECPSQLSWPLLSKQDYSLPHFPPQSKARTPHLLSVRSGCSGSQAPGAGSTPDNSSSSADSKLQEACFLQQGVLTNPQAARQVYGGENIRLDW